MSNAVTKGTEKVLPAYAGMIHMLDASKSWCMSCSPRMRG